MLCEELPYSRDLIILERGDPDLEVIYFSYFSFIHFYRKYFLKMVLSKNPSIHFMVYADKTTADTTLNKLRSKQTDF